MNIQEQFNEIIKKINVQLNRLVEKIKNLSTQEKIAYGCIAAGLILIILAVLIW